VVDALLQQVNLYEVRKRKLGTFSGGMRQRFGIAQALLGSPRLVIVDEPTAGLDPEERNRFLNLLAEIGEHVVVILSTHIVEDVTDLCPRMAIISRGEVLQTGEPLRGDRSLEGAGLAQGGREGRSCPGTRPRTTCCPRGWSADARCPCLQRRPSRRKASSRSSPTWKTSISSGCAPTQTLAA
jgi:energy-coupling factor transporter ATP-binding protein EcfA2